MRTRTPLKLGISALLVAALGMAFVQDAGADEKQDCSDAYEKTQSLRREGKLQAAREQASMCTRDPCAEFIRADCTTWLSQIEASQPTVVFEVRDAKGADIIEARVALDGRPWLAAVDVNAHPIDPGKHTLRFTMPGGSMADQTVVVREGDKNLKVSVVLGGPAPPPPAAPAPAPGPSQPMSAPAESKSERSVAPWVIGGIGVASLAVGGILGIVVLGNKSTFDEHCDPNANCDAEGDSARDSGQTLGPISTVTLVLGGIGVGVATVWLITDSSSDEGSATASASTSIGTGPVVSSSGAGWAVRGGF